MATQVAEGIIIAIVVLMASAGIANFLWDEYLKFEDWLRRVCGWNN